MRIRNKMLLAMAVPAGLLVAQIVSVSWFIRESQEATKFISSAHAVIEADFAATDLVATLREEVKQLPSTYVVDRTRSAGDRDPSRTAWTQLTALIDSIGSSGAVERIEPSAVERLNRTFAKASQEYEESERVAAGAGADLNQLMERAVFTDRALIALADALNALAIELRKHLQAAVDREREIHNRPIIAGVAVGSLALLLLIGFAWLYVRNLAGPIRALQEGATRIGRGDLTSRIDVRTDDELQSLAEHFNQMAGQLQESYANLEGKVQERTQQLARSVSELEALGEISRAVNSSLELETVLARILAHACTLADAGGGAIYVAEAEAGRFRIAATHGMDQALVRAIRARSTRLGDTVVGRCVALRDAAQIPDLAAEPDYPLHAAMMQAGIRALLGVPLQREGEVIGALIVRRKRTGRFAEDTVELVKSFAAQSALAVHNARLFHEMEQKSRQLAAANRHKSEFLANMSHELRTPLNAVLGYAELIQDGIYGEVPDKIREVMERIQQNGRHLLGLINDVLDLSKIEAGELKLAPVDYSMRELMLDVASATEALASEKRIELRIDVPADLPPGRGDERRLTQVLLNLVGNAIKFTDGGSVTLRAAVEGEQFVVSVSDTGPGIAEADRERIFGEFQKVDSSSTRKKGGTGLGLAIARRIVELHGGRIWVESSPGQGATFSFTLPLSPQAQVAAE